MSLREIVLMACPALALAAAPAQAAPVWIEGGPGVDMRGAVTSIDLDVERQGYITAFRAASLRSVVVVHGVHRFCQAIYSRWRADHPEPDRWS